ncbi:MAG: peroxiredoxin [Myxococcota bacterium]|nr:peroxiredoxin [Myxococcota bacterium]
MVTQDDVRAPAFDLESDSGKRVTLKDFTGKWLVLYFYPKDNTPGCSREAQEFGAAVARFAKLGAEVVGVSRDTAKTHCGFKEKMGVGFALLSDAGLLAHKAYGAWGMKTMYGKAVEGVIRSTFLIAPNGFIARSWSGVKVDGHVEKVIEALEKARAGEKSDSGAGGGVKKARQ